MEISTARKQVTVPPEELDALARPVLDAATMPPEAYWSPDLYDREVESIFMKEWIWVGREEDIPSAGDYFTVEIVGEPLIVVRSAEGDVHAHLNVCRHRGCMLVEPGDKGTAKAFRCPYHGWMYGLRGELRGVPDFAETNDFDKADYPLHAAAVETWEGYILVNLDPDAPSFRESVSDTAKYGLDTYDMANQRTTHTWTWDVACNWKTYVENFIEEYHVPWVHAETFQPVAPMKGWKEFPEITEEPWILMVGQFPGLSMSDSGEPELTVAPETANLAPEYVGMPIAVFYPTLGVLNAVDATLAFSMMPDGPDRCALTVRLLLPKKDAAAYEAGDSQIAEIVEQYARNTVGFVEEDNKAVEMQQRGLRSRRATQGRFSKHEGLAWKFDNWVAQRAYGPSGSNGSGAESRR